MQALDRRRFFLAIGVSVVAAVGGGALHWKSHRQPVEKTPRPVAPIEVRPVTRMACVEKPVQAAS